MALSGLSRKRLLELLGAVGLKPLAGFCHIFLRMLFSSLAIQPWLLTLVACVLVFLVSLVNIFSFALCFSAFLSFCSFSRSLFNSIRVLGAGIERSTASRSAFSISIS
ncbi:hypothetical protein OMCYN_01855 [cyanobiont of Ornithocercus magnificus]|nr:hypothetical protein OMCYN_01855 [cyanobiont of Ornithocercus magnificus]